MTVWGKPKPSPPSIIERNAYIMKLYREGLTYRDIALSLQQNTGRPDWLISEVTVRTIVRRHKLRPESTT